MQAARIALSWMLAGSTSGVAAQTTDQPVKIGVLGDLSSVYSDIGGKGLVDAARMAVEDFGGNVLGQPIEPIYTDAQSKADIAASKARQWFDVEGVAW